MDNVSDFDARLFIINSFAIGPTEVSRPSIHSFVPRRSISITLDQVEVDCSASRLMDREREREREREKRKKEKGRSKQTGSVEVSKVTGRREEQQCAKISRKARVRKDITERT